LLHNALLSCALFTLSPPPVTVCYTLSLHDALPIYLCLQSEGRRGEDDHRHQPGGESCLGRAPDAAHRHGPPGECRQRPRTPARRSEEHTSELQSRENLVCRLLLEKKKKRI